MSIVLSPSSGAGEMDYRHVVLEKRFFSSFFTPFFISHSVSPDMRRHRNPKCFWQLVSRRGNNAMKNNSGLSSSLSLSSSYRYCVRTNAEKVSTQILRSDRTRLITRSKTTCSSLEPTVEIVRLKRCLRFKVVFPIVFIFWSNNNLTEVLSICLHNAKIRV